MRGGSRGQVRVFATSSSAGRSRGEQGFGSLRSVTQESTKCCHFLPYASVHPTIPLTVVLKGRKGETREAGFCSPSHMRLSIRLVILLSPFSDAALFIQTRSSKQDVRPSLKIRFQDTGGEAQ